MTKRQANDKSETPPAGLTAPPQLTSLTGQRETPYPDYRDDHSSGDLKNNTEGDMTARQRSETPAEGTGAAETGGGGGGSERESRTRATGMPPHDSGKPDHAEREGEALGSRLERTSVTSPRQGSAGRAGRGHGAEENWTVAAAAAPASARDPIGGASPGQGEKDGTLGRPRALLLSLSASADAMLADGSKAVRAKALGCSLRILEVHGDPACLGLGEEEVLSGGVRRALSMVG